MSGIDKTKFRVYFDEYFNALSNFAYGYVHDKTVAEDIVQDVFVKFWMKREVIQADNNVKSFLFQSTKNRAIEIIRRNKLNDTMVLEKTKEIESDERLMQEADNYLMKQKIFASIRQLPPKCQQVFKMSKINGLTYNEIAAELDISVKTVENQIGKALKFLREKLNK